MAYLTIGNRQLEYVWHGPGPDEAPTLVFLHEGLGCIAMWRDFPERLAEQTGCGAVVYSRAGYGNSDPINSPRNVRFMHDEALITLPMVLDALNIKNAILIGHSDGGSISIIYAGATNDSRVRGLILEAPHVFVEEHGLVSIRKIGEDYRVGDLKRRLERYHGQYVDTTFWGWNDIWLDPAFRTWNIEEYLPRINVPILLIQGADDNYGTVAQVQAIQSGSRSEVRTVVLPDCGHSPHLEQSHQTRAAMDKFIVELQPTFV